MNIKTTLFLLAVLAGVAVYFLVFERERTHINDPLPPQGEAPLLDPEVYQANGVSAVVIEAGGRVEELGREGRGQWMQTKPVRFPLSTVRVNGILNEAARLVYIEKFTPGQDGKPTLEKCGLDKPRVTIHLKGEAQHAHLDRQTGKPFTETKPFHQQIKLGAALTGSRGYAQVNDDPHVYVVNNLLHSILPRESATDWRQRSFEVPNDAQTDRIVMTVEGKTMEMRKVAGDWQFGPPVNDRVAPRAPAAILGLVRGAEVGVFVSEGQKPLSAFGLENPAIEVVVHTPALEPAERTLRIGDAADPSGTTYYANWSMGPEPSPVVFTVLREARGRFVAPRIDELRDPRISLVKSSALKEVKVTTPTGVVRLERSPAKGWTFAPGEGQPQLPYQADQQAVGQLVDAVLGATAKYFQPRALRKNPIATLEFAGATGPEKLEFFAAPPEAQPKEDETPLLMVLRNNETTGYLVPRSSLQPVLEPVIKLRDRQIVDLKPEQITALTLKRFDGIHYEFKRFTTAVDPTGSAQWQLVGADKFERDGLEQLLKVVASLRAETWLAESGEVGPRTVELTLVTAGGQARTITLDLDSRQARIAGGDGVFVASEQTALYFDAEYRPRSVLELAPGEVVQVTITKGQGKPWTIGKDEFGRFNALAPDGKPITTTTVNPQVAARLFDALTPLRVWRHVEAPQDIAALGSPATTVEVVTRAATKHTVKVGFKDRPELATLDNRWFTLSPDTLGKLGAEPIKKEEKGK